MDIFTKLDKIKIQAIDKLGSEDKDFVLFVEKCYESKLAFDEMLLTDMKATLAKLNSTDFFGRNQKQSAFSFTAYDLSRAISKAEEELPNVKDYYVSKILDHFEKKYNLQIQSNYLNESRIKALKKEPALSNILDFLFEAIGGSTLKEAAKSNLITDLRKRTVMRIAKLKGDSISFESFVHVETTWKGESELGSHSIKQVNLLLTCISLFEFDEMENKTGMSFDGFTVQFDPKEPIILRNCKKAISFRIYKNGNVALKFVSPAEAAQFQNYFSLNIA